MLEVSCAVIVNAEGLILVAQRSADMPLPFKWEFPGGKVEPGENPEQALHREIAEELGIAIQVLKRLSNSIYSYPEKEICLIPFLCRITDGEICLKEHLACVWDKPADLLLMDLAEADIPIIREIIRELS